MSSLEIPAPRDDYTSYHKTLKLKSFFQAWRRAYQQSTPQPISKGIAVYAAFKWIETTLENRRRMPTEVYHFPRHLAKEKDGQESHYFLSRLRDYVCRNMQISIERMPYFVHSIALLDAFQMARLFLYWKGRHKQIQRMRHRQIRRKVHYYFTQWRIFNLRNDMIEDARIAVALTRERRVLKQTFRNWRVQMKAFFRQRVCVIPFYRRHAFHQWRTIMKLRRWQAYTRAQGQHYYIRRLKRVWLSRWLANLCRLSQARKVTNSGEIQSWVLSSVKYRFFVQESSFGRSLLRTVVHRSKYFARHPLILRMLQDFALPLNIDFEPDISAYEESNASVSSVVIQRRLQQAYEALQRVMRVVRDRPKSRTSQRALIETAAIYYRYRTLVSVTRKWMLRIVQRVLDHSAHDEEYALRLKHPSSKRSQATSTASRRGRSPSPVRFQESFVPEKPLNIADLSPIRPVFPIQQYRSDSLHQKYLQGDSPSLSPSSPPIRYTKFQQRVLGDTTKTLLRYYILQWRKRAYRLHYIHRRGMWIQQEHHRNKLGSLFGAWIMVAARYQSLARVSNRVMNQRVRRDLYVSFFAWRHVFERARLIHQNERHLLRIKSQEIQEFTELYRHKVHSKTQGTILKVWALFVRDRRRGKILSKMWEKIQYRLYPYHGHPLGRIFHHWRELSNQDIVVTCFQRCWRGYRTRFILLPSLYRYVQWYKRRIPSMFALRKRHILQQGWLVFQKHHNYCRQKFVRLYLLRQRKRLFQRWWQRRRHVHISKRQCHDASGHYWLQRKHQTLNYLQRNQQRMLFLYRLIRASRRAQARFAFSQLRYVSMIRKRNREITQRAHAKRFVFHWLRWRRIIQGMIQQRVAGQMVRLYLLRPRLLRWKKWTQYSRYLAVLSTTIMNRRKLRLYIRKWHRQHISNRIVQQKALLHDRRRSLQRSFRQFVVRLLGEEFYVSGKETTLQQLRRHKRRQRRRWFDSHYIPDYASLPRSLQVAKRSRYGKNNSNHNDDDYDMLMQDLRGHLHSRLYRGRISQVFKFTLWKWRTWSIRRRQYRKHVHSKMAVMQRRHKSKFFHYLLQLWRENNPNSIPGQGYSSRRQRQKHGLHKKGSKLLPNVNKHSHLVVHAQHRTRDKQQQRLAWKAYAKRAAQRRKQLGVQAIGSASSGYEPMTMQQQIRNEYLCEVYGYFHRWLFYRQRRKRFGHLVRDIHQGYWLHHSKLAWKRWAIEFTKRIRQQDKSLRIASLFRLRKNKLNVFRCLQKLRQRHRNQRKCILWYQNVRKPFRTTFWALQYLKRRQRLYHRVFVLRFKKIIHKYRKRMFHFLERLKLLVYHRKYAKPAIIAQTKEKYRLQLQFRKFRTLCARYPLRRKLRALILHRRRQKQLRQAIRYWFKWTLLKQELQRIVRRFVMIPTYKHWFSRTFEVLHARRAIAQVQRKQHQRILTNIVKAWRIRAIYQQRIFLQAQIIRRRYERKEKQEYFLHWIQALDQHILYQRFLTISAKHYIRVKQKYLRIWLARARENERITYQNLLFGWQHWRTYVQRRRYYHHQQYQRAKVYDLWLRSMRRYLYRWIVWSKRMRYQRPRCQFPSLTNPLYRRQIQQKCMKYFRRWKRAMFLKHWHNEQHRNRSQASVSSSSLWQNHRAAAAAVAGAATLRGKRSVHFPPSLSTAVASMPSSNNDEYTQRWAASTEGDRETSHGLFSPQRPLSMSSFSNTATATRPTGSTTTSGYDDKYAAHVAHIQPLSPFKTSRSTKSRNRNNNDDDEDEEEANYDVPYLSPVRTKSQQKPTHYTTEMMLSVDELAAKRRSNATLQAITSSLASHPQEPALSMHKYPDNSMYSATYYGTSNNIINNNEDNGLHVSQSHDKSLNIARKVRSGPQSSSFALPADHHQHRRHGHGQNHDHDRVFVVLKGFRTTNIGMIHAHHHYTRVSQTLLGQSQYYPHHNQPELTQDRIVHGSKAGLLHTYTLVRTMCHWFRIARRRSEKRQKMGIHRIINAWRLHTLTQRLRREAFIHRLLEFRRKQLGYYIAWVPWRHIVHTNQLGRALMLHRHRSLQKQTWSRWLEHQAQRSVIRAKWARIPMLLTHRILFPFAMKQWYLATHQRLSIARPWIMRYVWNQKWKKLLLAKRFARYVLLVKRWKVWCNFIQWRKQRKHTFHRRFHVLHRIVRKQFVVKYHNALQHAWKQWMKKIHSPQLPNHHHNAIVLAKALQKHNAIQSLCLSQAGQVMLFHNIHPLSWPWIQSLSVQQRRKLPRLEIIRAALWHRYIAPLEIQDLRIKREYQRRQRIYQRILREQSRRDQSEGYVDYMSRGNMTEDVEAAAKNNKEREKLGSLRERMAAVLTPATSLGRYRSELSRAKVMEEAQELYGSIEEHQKDEDFLAKEEEDAEGILALRMKRHPTAKWISQQYIGLRENFFESATS